MLLIRHAQSEWNLHFSRTKVDPGIPDPPLTAEGVQQAETLAHELRHHGIRRLVTSPYRRALQTATILNRTLDVPINIDARVRERCAFSCDEGSAPAVLAIEWPSLDFSELQELWWGGLVEGHESLAERCAAFREHAETWDDRHHVAVVTHWGFIRAMTGDLLGNCETVRLAPQRASHDEGARS